MFFRVPTFINQEFIVSYMYYMTLQVICSLLQKDTNYVNIFENAHRAFPSLEITLLKTGYLIYPDFPRLFQENKNHLDF